MFKQPRIIAILACFFFQTAFTQTYSDKPYLQDYAKKYALKQDVYLLKSCSDRNGVIKVLSSEGLLQPFEKSLVQENFYRPLTDMNIHAMQIYRGQFVYLTDEAVLSNAWAGKLYIEHNIGNAAHLAMGVDFSFMLGSSGELAYFENGEKVWQKSLKHFEVMQIVYEAGAQNFLILTPNALYSFNEKSQKLKKCYQGSGLTAISIYEQKLAIGTEEGFLLLDMASLKPVTSIIKKIPWTKITCLREINGQIWFGSTRGAFVLKDEGRFDYYASRRWLNDDHVLDIAAGPDGSVLVLTKTALNQIHFDEMTLAGKAAYFEKIQRQRHIRYGFSSHLTLAKPGDLSKALYTDTDNDGLWTSMYLAAELFRYAVTKSQEALQNVYETFEAMEHLDLINPIKGFPSRTYEREGYPISDNRVDKDGERIWRLTDDKNWRWKSTTSSDESCGHFFVYSLFAEIVPDSSWKQRAVDQIVRQMDHIIENDWYLVSWNGKPTEWGRWNPDYVNSFPIENGDRRLNSTLILAFLQTAYHFSGNDKYKEKANELIDSYGYLENTLRPASAIKFVEGLNLSDGWNHSDDEMYFLTAPALYKYAFNEEMKQEYFKTIHSHWQIERSEKSALWNFLYAMSGGKDIDLQESVWWLKEFPMDLISWNVHNSHRKDLQLIKPNFRKQTVREILPPDERPLHLHNNASYRIDGGEGASQEYPPYIYLLPYWMGRYAGAIGPAN